MRLLKFTHSDKKSSPARLTAGLLSGACHWYDSNARPVLSQNTALSAELQRHASRNLDVRGRKEISNKNSVDISARFCQWMGLDFWYEDGADVERANSALTVVHRNLEFLQ